MGQNASFRMVFSTEATVQEIDPTAEELLGWDLEIANAAGLGLLHPSDRIAFGAMLKFVRSQPDADAILEVRLISGDGAGDGDWIPASVSATNELHHPDRPGLVVSVVLTDPQVTQASAANPHVLTTSTDHDFVISESAVDGAHGPEVGVFDQDAPDAAANGTGQVVSSAGYDPSEPTDIGILLRLGSSIIDVVTGPVQGKLGCHPDSLAGLHLWEILHRDDEAQFTEALDAMEAKSDGEFLTYGPLRFLSSGGASGDEEERIFDTTVIRKPSGLVVRARDTGERNIGSAEADTPESAVVFLDEKYNVTYASATFPALVGRRATSAVGMELLAAVHPSDRSYAEQRLRQPGLEGQIHGFLRVPVSEPDHTKSATAAPWRWIEVIGRNYLDDPSVGQIALQLTVVHDEPERSGPADVPEPERLGTFTRDAEGNVSFINDVLLDMLGNLDAVDFATQQASLVNVDQDGVSETIEIDNGDGKVRFLRSRMSPIIGADGERTGDVAVVEDITRLVESGDLPDRVTDGTEGSVLVVERGAGIRYLSADLTELTGADVATELHDFLTPKSAVLVRSEVWPAVLSDGVWSGQLWLRSIDGPAVPFHAQFYNEADLDAGAPLASVILSPLDSVPEWDHEDQLAVDPLTLLSSGAGLKRRAVRAIAKTVGNRSMVAVALIEIDETADVIPSGDGDSELTAAEQDALALAIADRLSLACRHDESAARLDQRTFAVLSQRLGDAIDLEHLTSRIVDELSPTFVVDTPTSQRYLTVQFSLGLAHGGEGSLSADELFDNAGLALQRARSRGQIRTATVGEHGQLEVLGRRALEEDFRTALSSDQLANQLDNVYQVVLPGLQAKSVASGELSGAGRRFEALVRWHSPSRGLVGASEVVELADDLGMATAVGHRVLDRSLDFLASTQRKHDVSVQVDVNISPSQAIERGFASRLDALLRLYEVDPEQLGIELSEPAILSANPALDASLEQLRKLGVRLVVDDVTGRLFRSPMAGIDELKIDRRLVEGVGRHAADTAQVAGILARSQERGLAVTAVGVATGRQLDLLTELGCSWFQGFLLGRPQSAGEHDLSGSVSDRVWTVNSSTQDQHGVA